jgi:hypothetical protein
VPPATVDIPVDFDRRFKSIITDQLCGGAKDAVMNQKDPALMTNMERKTIHQSILKAVTGTVSFSI